MILKRLFYLVIVCATFASCTRYTPAKHSFELIEQRKAVAQLLPLLLNSVYEEDGIIFNSAKDYEQWFAKKYFQNFPEDFEKNYVMTKLYYTQYDQYRVVYSNMACTDQQDACVNSLLFVIDPPFRKGRHKNIIFSCKRKISDTESMYRLVNFTAEISLFMKGNGRANHFAELKKVYMNDFEKYDKMVSLINSLYPEYKIGCP